MVSGISHALGRHTCLEPEGYRSDEAGRFADMRMVVVRITVAQLPPALPAGDLGDFPLLRLE